VKPHRALRQTRHRLQQHKVPDLISRLFLNDLLTWRLRARIYR